MKQIIPILLLTFVTYHLSAQEQFFRERGGFSFLYGSAYTQGENSNVFGFSAAFNPGIVLSIGSIELGEESNTMFSAGYLSKHKDLNRYVRGGLSLSYASSGRINIRGFSVQSSNMINAQKDYPTSIDFGVSIFHLSMKDKQKYGYTIPNELVPSVNVGLSQAFKANGNIAPILGVGLAHDLNQSITSFSFSLGFNLNFDGPKL